MERSGYSKVGRDRAAVDPGRGATPAAGAPRPCRSTPHCATASRSVGRGTALASRCIRASEWHSHPRYHSRPTRPTCGVYAYESPPASLELGSFQLQALGPLRYVCASPPAFHPSLRARRHACQRQAPGIVRRFSSALLHGLPPLQHPPSERCAPE
jgi:hypothetical protein